jgi:hypothetical protein
MTSQFPKPWGRKKVGKMGPIHISAFLKIAIILHLSKFVTVATVQGPTIFMKLFEILKFRITTMVWQNQATV